MVVDYVNNRFDRKIKDKKDMFLVLGSRGEIRYRKYFILIKFCGKNFNSYG